MNLNQTSSNHITGLNEECCYAHFEHSKYSSNELAGVLGLSNSNTSKSNKIGRKERSYQAYCGKDDKRQMYFVLTNAGQKAESIKC